MSRIGKKAIPVPAGVKIAVDAKSHTINIEGPKGKLRYAYRPEVSVVWSEPERKLTCTVPEARAEDRQTRAYWGTVRARIATMVKGVTEGYTKSLEVVGVGWSPQAAGKKLKLNIGFCHPVEMAPPESVNVAVAQQIITITGPDKQLVGQFAANVRAVRPPEPYNGKGIKYTDEVIQRKAGKVFGS